MPHAETPPGLPRLRLAMTKRGEGVTFWIVILEGALKTKDLPWGNNPMRFFGFAQNGKRGRQE